IPCVRGVTPTYGTSPRWRSTVGRATARSAVGLAANRPRAPTNGRLPPGSGTHRIHQEGEGSAPPNGTSGRHMAQLDCRIGYLTELGMLRRFAATVAGGMVLALALAG